MMPASDLKYLILVGDGMGDLPVTELGGKTPLEAAATPAMDRLAAAGRLWRLQTVPAGFPPGSDVANLSLLGYRPEQCYSGRAPLEAASMGVEVPPGHLAFRCNLVTLRRDGDRLWLDDYSGGHIGSDEAGELIRFLDQRLGNELIRLYPGVSYRHLLIFGKTELNGLVTAPPHDHTGQEVGKLWRAYQAVPELARLMAEAHRLLADHAINRQRRAAGRKPANGIWLWGEGAAPAMATLEERFAVDGALISAVDLLKGIGVYAGMEIIEVAGATGYLDTNYQGKVAAALDALGRHRLVLVHVEAPDEAAHQGLLTEKIQAIEQFDQRIVQPIFQGLARLGSPFRLVVAMDHYTPLARRTHIDLPVPILLYDSRRPGTDGPSYSEAHARQAKLLAHGEAFMNLLLER